MSKLSNRLCVLISMIMLYLLSPTYTAYACLHGVILSNNQTNTKELIVKQSAQQGLILYKDGIEDLILKVDYVGEKSSSLAWVIPIPNVPTYYGVTDGQIFDDLSELLDVKRIVPVKATPRLRSKRKSSSRNRDRNKGTYYDSLNLTVSPKVQIGPYQIQTLSSQDKMTLKPLNEWMIKNNFKPFKRKQIRYYLDQKWAFVTVKIVPPKKQKLPTQGSLPPLHLSFKSSKIIYPLKMSTHMGRFSTMITVITDQKIEQKDFAGVRARGFEVVSGQFYLPPFLKSKKGVLVAQNHLYASHSPSTLKPFLKKRFAHEENLHLSTLFNHAINGKRARRWNKHVVASDQPKKWRHELAIPPFEDVKRYEKMNRQVKGKSIRHHVKVQARPIRLKRSSIMKVAEMHKEFIKKCLDDDSSFKKNYVIITMLVLSNGKVKDIRINYPRKFTHQTTRVCLTKAIKNIRFPSFKEDKMQFTLPIYF